MKQANVRMLAWFAAGIIVGLAALSPPQFVRADARNPDEGRLRRLEDRQEIEELFAAYGTTLDRHDFDAFGRLFAEDAVFVGGPGEPVRGRTAIQSSLEKTLTSNPSHLPTPDFHLFFGPSIQVDGDHAVAQSKGAYVVPDTTNNGARIVFLVSYQDTLVRQAGHWLFARREIHAGIPAPAAR
ncbi:MAG TPA: nuclear transport factor 2 family protein [Steroidobacteraceae bacterium]|nr:nuclear transport factor 2 family protein [Steroidobacteraceae bacterium]